MASTSETGHAKNAANFEDLISFCTGYGAAYKPTKPSITMAALNTKRTEAVNALAVLNSSIPALTNAVNQRIGGNSVFYVEIGIGDLKLLIFFDRNTF